jgi:hypothetical protein
MVIVKTDLLTRYCTFTTVETQFLSGYINRGAHLKKSRRAEGDAKNFGVFRVKNHDFTTKNLIFSNCGGRRKIFWGISCEKSRFYAKKNHIFSNGSPGVILFEMTLK